MKKKSHKNPHSLDIRKIYVLQECVCILRCDACIACSEEQCILVSNFSRHEHNDHMLQLTNFNCFTSNMTVVPLALNTIPRPIMTILMHNCNKHVINVIIIILYFMHALHGATVPLTVMTQNAIIINCEQINSTMQWLGHLCIHPG